MAVSRHAGTIWVKKNLNLSSLLTDDLFEKEFHLWIVKNEAMPGMSQFAALVVELAAKLGAAVPSAKVGTSHRAGNSNDG